MLKSVLDYLEKSEKLFPDKAAVIDEKGRETYKELADKSRRIGTGLVAKGLRENSVVVVLMGKERAALSAFWGITYAGAIYAPLDSKAPIKRLQLIMEVLKPCFVLTDTENRSKAEALMPQEKIVLSEELLKTEPDRRVLEAIQKRRIDLDPLYIICTSGSTGIPKGVVISHRAVIDFAEEASETMEFSEKESFANQAPFYFDASVPDLYCSIRNGATLHIIPEGWFSFPIKVLEYIKEHKINAIFWVPSALIVTANLRALQEVDVSCLKKVMFCGEVMPTKQYNVWKKYVPEAKYVNYYGPSETTYASTYYVIDRDFSNEEALPIGRAALNTGVLILDEEDKCCKPGQVGELCIRGSGVALGYYNNPEKTAEAFVQNPMSPCYPDIMYRTGDLVRENAREEIEYVGRKDFQIKYMGYRIELGEIEAAGSGCEGVRRVCCIFHENKIVFFYEGSAQEHLLREILAKKLPEYMVPKLFVRLQHLPVNANGKIDRVYLKKGYLEGEQDGTSEII